MKSLGTRSNLKAAIRHYLRISEVRSSDRELGLGAMRTRVAFGSRPLGHLHMAARGIEHGSSRPAVVAGLIGSLAGDLFLTLRMSDPAYRPGAIQRFVEIVDAAVWVTLERSPSTMAGSMAVNAQGSTLEACYRLGAGNDAVPVYDKTSNPTGSQPSTPDLLGAIAPMLGPFVIGSIWRRRLGLRINPSDIVWTAGMGMIGYLAGRHRDRLQEASRQEWQSISAERVEFEAVSARTDLVSSSSPAHDFKKTLLVLGVAGSERAAEAAREHAARPGMVATDWSIGRPLRLALPSLSVDPPELGRHWLTNEQAELIRHWADGVVDGAPDGADLTVRVTVPDASTLDLHLLDVSHRISSEPPRYRAQLDPTSVAFAASALLRASDMLPDFKTLPRGVAPMVVALDLIGAARYWRNPPTDADMRIIASLAGSTAAIGLCSAASKHSQTRGGSGDPHHAGISIAQGSALVMAVHWSRMQSRHRILLPTVLIGFAVASRLRARHPIIAWFESATVLGQTVLSCWRLTDLIDVEVDALQHELHASYWRQVEAARHAVIREELDRYREELEVARTEFEAFGGALDPGTRWSIEVECLELERWLDRQFDLLDTDRQRLSDPCA